MATADELADTVEIALLCIEERAAGIGRIEGLLERVTDGEQPRLDLAIRTMRRRQTLLGDAYPFDVQDVAIRRDDAWPSLAYLWLLAMSPSSLSRELMNLNDISVAAVKFERIVVEAVQRYLGNGAKAVRFAWPSDSGRPQEFPEAIKWLADLMGVKLGGGYRQPRRKDGGVDVIGWRPFRDGKSGFPIVLVQCTIQADLVSKSLDIDVRNWSSWLELVHDPSTILTAPQVIPGNTEIWNELALKNLVFDRLRLVELLDRNFSSSLQEEMSAWLLAVVQKVRVRIEST
jgi:hypothetical protein